MEKTRLQDDERRRERYTGAAGAYLMARDAERRAKAAGRMREAFVLTLCRKAAFEALVETYPYRDEDWRAS